MQLLALVEINLLKQMNEWADNNLAKWWKSVIKLTSSLNTLLESFGK